MKIRTKLTLIYTLITALLLCCLLFSIYTFISIYIRNSFYTDLHQRALITAQVYLEEDELEASHFKQIKAKFLQNLPTEVIRMYDLNNHPAFILDSSGVGFSNDLIEKTRHEKYIELEEQNRQVVGLFYRDNQGDFVVMVSGINESGMAKLSYLKKTLGLSFIICLVIVFFTGRFFAKKALEPISRITKRVNEITGSNLHLRLESAIGKDEISELSATFNQMLNRLESVFEMQNNFVHNASHELRTPITSMMVQLDVVLEKSRTNEEYKETLVSVLHEAEKLNQLTTSLLNLAKTNFDGPSVRNEPIFVDDLVVEVKKELEHQSSGRKISIDYKMPADSEQLMIKGNKQLMHIAIFNLLENACKYSMNKEVQVFLECKSNGVEIRIKDQGIGIPDSEIGKIFEAFYRGSNAYSHTGTGVGLSLTKKIIELHHGTINVVSTPTSGSIFTIQFEKN